MLCVCVCVCLHRSVSVSVFLSLSLSRSLGLGLSVSASLSLSPPPPLLSLSLCLGLGLGLGLRLSRCRCPLARAADLPVGVVVLGRSVRRKVQRPLRHCAAVAADNHVGRAGLCLAADVLPDADVAGCARVRRGCQKFGVDKEGDVCVCVGGWVCGWMGVFCFSLISLSFFFLSFFLSLLGG